MSEDLQQLRAIEQSIHTHRMQRQHLQSQLLECESALNELSKTTKAHKIIGSIMVEQDAQEMVQDLEDTRASLQKRVSAVKKQEEGLGEEARKLAKKIGSE